jgi:hypothetical protein
MSPAISDIAEEVKAYGTGFLGGKGEGLAKLNALSLPKVKKLRTYILSTSYFDRYIGNGRRLESEALGIVTSILNDLGDVPLGIRSSATNEAGIAAARISPVHAGENASFMLPNNYPDPQMRFSQAVQAICCIYDDFLQKQPASSREKMAIVINPIPGIFDDTLAGPVYYPYISGVANSFFPHALKNQNPHEGFARIAFGHGYATVLDDFPVTTLFLSISSGSELVNSISMPWT